MVRIYNAQSQDRHNRLCPGFMDGYATVAHGTPSLLNISSNVLKATGLTKLWFRRRQRVRGTNTGERRTIRPRRLQKLCACLLRSTSR